VYKSTFVSQALEQKRPTPGDDSRFEDEIGLFSGVEDLDEHTVHVVGLDSVPEERDENEIVAHDVGNTTTETRVGKLLSGVQHDQ